MGALLTPDDLAPFITVDPPRAEAMISDAESLAMAVAPCLSSEGLSDVTRAAAAGIVRRAVIRWHENGAGRTARQQAAGPFSVSDTTAAPQGLFFPAEINALVDLCRATTGDAFMVDMTGLGGEPQNPLERAWVNGPTPPTGV